MAQSSKSKEYYSCLKEETIKITKAISSTSYKTPSKTLSKSTKTFPPPEKLAYWHDDQYEFSM